MSEQPLPNVAHHPPEQPPARRRQLPRRSVVPALVWLVLAPLSFWVIFSVITGSLTAETTGLGWLAMFGGLAAVTTAVPGLFAWFAWWIRPRSPVGAGVLLAIGPGMVIIFLVSVVRWLDNGVGGMVALIMLLLACGLWGGAVYAVSSRQTGTAWKVGGLNLVAALILPMCIAWPVSGVGAIAFGAATVAYHLPATLIVAGLAAHFENDVTERVSETRA